MQRLENLEDAKARLSEDMREVMAEAKHEGFDLKVIREVLRIRKMPPAEAQERSELLDLYLSAFSSGS